MGKKYVDVDEEFWKPENEGDSIAGVLVRKQSEAGENKSMLYSLRNEENKLINVWGSTVLDDKMATVEEGEDIQIVYQGKVKPTGFGKEYHDYKIQKAEIEEDKDKEVKD